MYVDTIFLVAGPRGIGKSRFIERCAELVPPSDRPPELGPLFASEGPTINLVRLGDHRSRSYRVARLHIDIFTPFQDLAPLDNDGLREAISVDRFARDPFVAELSAAQRLFVVTLWASRRATLERWLDRITRAGGAGVRTNLVRIYSDASGDMLFDRLYEAWFGYLDRLAVAGHWIGDVEGSIAVRLLRR